MGLKAISRSQASGDYIFPLFPFPFFLSLVWVLPLTHRRRQAWMTNRGLMIDAAGFPRPLARPSRVV